MDVEGGFQVVFLFRGVDLSHLFSDLMKGGGILSSLSFLYEGVIVHLVVGKLESRLPVESTTEAYERFPETSIEISSLSSWMTGRASGSSWIRSSFRRGSR